MEAGDTIYFYYPGQRAEHGLYVEQVYEAMSAGNAIMMAQARVKVLPLATSIKITFGVHRNSAIIHKSSYDLDYCKIEFKGDFPDGRKDL